MIYPGSLVIKRLKYCFVLSMISSTWFLQNIQQRVFEYSSTMVLELAHHATSINQGIDAMNTYNDWHNCIADSFVGKAFGLVNKDNTPLEKLDVFEDGQAHKELVSLLNVLGLFMTISTIILTLSILHSIIWLALDLRFGKHKGITLVLIALAITLNFIIQDHVISHIDLL